MGAVEPKTRSFSDIQKLYEFIDAGGDISAYDDGVYARGTTWEKSPRSAELTLFEFWNDDGEPLDYDSSGVPFGAPAGLVRVGGLTRLRQFFRLMRESKYSMEAEEIVTTLQAYNDGCRPFDHMPDRTALEDVRVPTGYLTELRGRLILLGASTFKSTKTTRAESKEREALLIEMSSYYTDGASEAERIAMRALVKAGSMAPFALGAVHNFIPSVADGKPISFERALAVVALWDGQSDYRDMLLTLASLHAAAVMSRLDVVPIYERIAALCSDTNAVWDISTRDILLSFATGEVSSELLPEECTDS